MRPKRYRSNLINWGMLPFLIEEGELPFVNGDYLFIPNIRAQVENGASGIRGLCGKRWRPCTVYPEAWRDDGRGEKDHSRRLPDQL